MRRIDSYAWESVWMGRCFLQLRLHKNGLLPSLWKTPMTLSSYIKKVEENLDIEFPNLQILTEELELETKRIEVKSFLKTALKGLAEELMGLVPEELQEYECQSGCGCSYPNGDGSHEFGCAWKPNSEAITKNGFRKELLSNIKNYMDGSV